MSGRSASHVDDASERLLATGRDDSADTVATLRGNMSNLGIQPSGAEAIAEGIFRAATDGEDRLRCVLGSDARRFHATRSEVGPESFIADLRSRVFEGETS